MHETVALRGLRDRPFELLAELERRGRAVTASATTDTSQAGDWVGVALRMAGELYLVAREEAREVLGVPAPLTRVPGAKSWILGLANIRGQLLPMIDLRAYLGSGQTPTSRNSRVIVVNHRDIPAGLIVDEVLGFRPDIIEHQLAHTVKDPNGRAYNRTAHLAERRVMMQRWADYLDELKQI